MKRNLIWITVLILTILMAACSGFFPVETAPTLSIPELELNEGETLSISLMNYCNKGSSTSVTFEHMSGVGCLSGEKNCMFSYTPGYSSCPCNKDCVTETAIIKVIGEKGVSSSVIVKIKVFNTNRAPSISIPNKHVVAGNVLILDLYNFALDLDTGDILKFEMEGPGILKGSNSSLYTFEALKGSVGTTEIVEITAKDINEATASDEFMITVVSSNRPPAFAIPDQVIEVGKTLAINLLNFAIDPNGDNLIFKHIEGVGQVVDSSFIYTPTNNEIGTNYSKIGVFDGMESVSTIVEIEVIE